MFYIEVHDKKLFFSHASENFFQKILHLKSEPFMDSNLVTYEKK